MSVEKFTLHRTLRRNSSVPRSDPECGFARSGAESHAEEQATRAFRPIVQARAQCTEIASTAHNAVRSLSLSCCRRSGGRTLGSTSTTRLAPSAASTRARAAPSRETHPLRFAPSRPDGCRRVAAPGYAQTAERPAALRKGLPSVEGGRPVATICGAQPAPREEEGGEEGGEEACAKRRSGVSGLRGIRGCYGHVFLFLTKSWPPRCCLTHINTDNN